MNNDSHEEHRAEELSDEEIDALIDSLDEPDPRLEDAGLSEFDLVRYIAGLLDPEEERRVGEALAQVPGLAEEIEGVRLTNTEIIPLPRVLLVPAAEKGWRYVEAVLETASHSWKIIRELAAEEGRILAAALRQTLDVMQAETLGGDGEATIGTREIDVLPGRARVRVHMERDGDTRRIGVAFIGRPDGIDNLSYEVKHGLKNVCGMTPVANEGDTSWQAKFEADDAGNQGRRPAVMLEFQWYEGEEWKKKPIPIEIA